jgi:AraC-like DNA-binding protein
MRKAVCELAGGREHVRQVAFHAGYEDHGNFDRSFRSFFGVTPTLFRKLREER